MGLDLLGTSQPIASHAISSGIDNEHERLIRAYGDAVGEIQIVEQSARLFRSRIVSKKATVRLMLEDVSFQIGQAKFVRGISEVDRSIGSDVEIVRAAKRNSIGFGAEHGALSVRSNRHQNDQGISNDQVSIVIEYQYERTA